ncbi:PH-interacting protein-like [Amphibalanus amphitrite]|uniref:PH-interacting protein-like n=1 Tax=Amphibalanus amphitrite TaxID=1232801 RepID=UPI001C92A386|nr:PH-interacting protein-like [Amphibalanus amphitrite]
MDITNQAQDRRRREEAILPELLYLVAKFLDSSACKSSAKVLLEEIRQLKLVPDRYDWLGNRHERTWEEWDRLHPHVGGETLLRLCGNMLPLLDRLVPSGVRGLHSLLGAGSNSVLRTEPGSQQRHLPVHRVAARIAGRPILDPVGLKHTPTLPVSSFGRELQGSCLRRHLSTERLLSRTQLLKRTLGHLSAVYCVLFDRTGFCVITGADDRLVKVWSALDGRLLATLRGAAAEITDLAISGDNTLLAAGSCDKVIRVWDLQTTAPVAVLSGHGGMITALEFCPGPLPQQRLLVSTANDGCVAFWSYRDKERPGGGRPGVQFASRPVKINERVRPGQAQLICAAFSAGGTFLAIGGADHHVRVYRTDFSDGPERILELEAHSDRVDSIQWCHSGCRFVSGSKDGTAIVWTFERQEWCQRKLVMERRPEFREPHDDGRQRPLRVNMVRWTTDDAYVVTTVSDTSLRVWEATTGRLLHVLAGHTDEVFVVESHPKEPRLVLTAGHDGRLFIWDVWSGVALTSFFNHIEGEGHGGLFDARWSPCGLFIAATDSHGHLSHFGVSGNDQFTRVPYEQFFHTDYRPLMRDARHQVLDEQTQMAPHLLPPPLLVDRDGNPQSAAAQRLVPGRGHMTDQQLLPVLQPVNVEEDDLVDVEQLGPEVRQRRPTIDDMIERLAIEQAMRETAEEAEEAADGGAAPAAADAPVPEEAAGAGEPAAPAPPRPAAAASDWRHRRVAPRLSARELQRHIEYRSLEAELEQKHFEDEMARPRRPPSPTQRRLTTRERRRQRLLRRRRQPSQPDGPQEPAQLEQEQERRQERQEREQRVTRAARAVRAPFNEDFENPDNLSELGSPSGSSSGSDSDSDSEEEEVDASTRRSGASESSEYSDWVAESGVSLNPPQRQPKRLTARQRALRRRMRSGASEPDPEPRPGPSGTQSRPRRASPPPPAPAEEEEAVGSPESAARAGTSSKRQRPSRAARKRTTAGGSGESAASDPAPAAVTSSAQQQLVDTLAPSAWLSEVLPRKTPYFPQMGDELIYFRQGHQLYVEAVKRRKIYDIRPQNLPWVKQVLRDRELVRIIGIKYELRPPCLCCLKLGRLDPETGAVSGGSFTIKYHDMPDVVDFLVLRPTYETAMSRDWQPDDRFRSTIDDAWWTGRVLERRPLDPESPESPFLCYRVAWDTGESEPLSPWDMEPLGAGWPSDDEASQTSVPLTDEELRGAGLPGWRQRPEDWANDSPEAQMDRIRRCLEVVMQLAIAEPFLAPVDLNRYPTYAQIVEYPIDLSTIKARLENGFYRRITAVQFDVRYLASNTEKFNQPHSTIVRSARIITDVCLEMIGDSTCHDPAPLYRRHAAAYNSGGGRERDRRGGGQRAGPAGAGTGSGRRGSQRSPRVTRQIARRRFADKTWQELCAELLDNLVRHEDSEHFREPVNLDDYPDYLNLVESPMDLSSVREELEAGSYVSPQEFADDIRLIFHNSKTYNTNKRSTIFAMTLRLSCYFEEQMRPILTYFVTGQRPTRSSRRRHSDSDPQPSSSRQPGPSRSRPPEQSGRPVNGFAHSSDEESEEEEELPPRLARSRPFRPPAQPASGRLRGRVPVSYAEDSDSSVTRLARRGRLAAPLGPPPPRLHPVRTGPAQRRAMAAAAAAAEQEEPEDGAGGEGAEDGGSSSGSSSSSSSSSSQEDAEEEEEAVDEDEDEESETESPRLRPSRTTKYDHDSDWEVRERRDSPPARQPRRTGRARPQTARAWRQISGDDDDDDDDDFQPSPPKSRTRSRTASKKAPKRRRAADDDDDDEDSDAVGPSRPSAKRRRAPAVTEESEGDEELPPSLPPPPRPSAKRRRAPAVSEESEEEEPPPPSSPPPPRPSAKRKHAPAISEESEEEEAAPPPARTKRLRLPESDDESDEPTPPPPKARDPRRRRRHSSPEESEEEAPAPAASRAGRRVPRRPARLVASDDDETGGAHGHTNGTSGGRQKSSRSAAARAHALLALSDEDEDSDEARSARLARRLAHADAGWGGRPPEPRRRSFVSAEDEAAEGAPRISVSSRGRVRKLNPHAFVTD